MLMNAGVPVASDADPSAPESARPTLLCFSHLRWDFVFQRPQHVMSRFAREMKVVYWEEPLEIGERETPFLRVRQAKDSECPHCGSAPSARPVGGEAGSGLEPFTGHSCRLVHAVS